MALKNDVTVITAMELNESERAEILKSLHENFSFDLATFTVEAGILGGVKLAFQDRVIDCSIAHKLHQICNNLIQRK